MTHPLIPGVEVGENYRVLEIGCGKERLFPDAVTLDINSIHRPTVVHDLEQTPYPFPDDSFDIILCCHILEHVRQFVPCVAELHRILKPGGLIFVEAPYFSSVFAHADPTHVRAFTAHSFDYFKENSALTAFAYAPIRFAEVRVEIVVPGNGFLSRLFRYLIRRHTRRYEERWAYIFPRHTIRYWLRKPDL